MPLKFDNIRLRHGKSIASSRNLCDTTTQLGSHIFDMPVTASNMQSILTPEICKTFDENNWFYVQERVSGTDFVLKFVEDAQETFNVVSISVGVKAEWLFLVRRMHERGLRVDYFTVDVAISYNDNVLPLLNTIKEYYPNAYVICGNGATKEWAEWLQSQPSLVDCLKVGIGVSPSCRTAQYTGYGSSPLESLQEVLTADHEFDIMLDGGLTEVGDITKALVFGADFVMSGSLFAHCRDTPSGISGTYYGNASARAKGTKHVEGEEIQLKPYDKTVREQMQLMKESLQSGISYSGGLKVYDLFGKPYDLV